ncbi:MAG: hypothetical protein ABW321_29885, partial [Polyangiales bacterium]
MRDVWSAVLGGHIRFATFALASSCASASPEVAGRSSALHVEDANAPPTFAALPDVPKTQQSPRIVQGLSLARHVLADGLPTPPDDRRYVTLQGWIDQTVAPWISTRRDNTDETRFEFALQAGASDEERVIALGVLGLLEENTALELTHIPVPIELDTEPEIADIFRDLVETQAKPFRNAAKQQYRSCSAEADRASDDVHRWATFCRGRYARLTPSP